MPPAPGTQRLAGYCCDCGAWTRRRLLWPPRQRPNAKVRARSAHGRGRCRTPAGPDEADLRSSLSGRASRSGWTPAASSPGTWSLTGADSVCGGQAALVHAALTIDPRAPLGARCAAQHRTPTTCRAVVAGHERAAMASYVARRSRLSVALSRPHQRPSVQVTAAAPTREVLVAGSQAHVLYYNSQSKAWQPAGQGPSRVELYRDPARGTYRVVARNIADQSVRAHTHTPRGPKTAAH